MKSIKLVLFLFITLCIFGCKKDDPVSSSPTLSGRWECRLSDQSNPSIGFTTFLDLTDNSGTVTGTFTPYGNSVPMSGTLSSSGDLTLNGQISSEAYFVKTKVNTARNSMNGYTTFYGSLQQNGTRMLLFDMNLVGTK